MAAVVAVLAAWVVALSWMAAWVADLIHDAKGGGL